jgi:hypothetical protein
MKESASVLINTKVDTNKIILVFIGLLTGFVGVMGLQLFLLFLAANYQ